MYVEIKDDKLLSWCENAYNDYEYVNINYADFKPEQYRVQNGELINISETEEWTATCV